MVTLFIHVKFQRSFAGSLENYIKDTQSNAMTKKGQKTEGASIVACFSLPMIYCWKTSRIVGNRKHFGLFNERKKSLNII